MRGAILLFLLLLGPLVAVSAEGNGTFPPISGWTIVPDTVVYTPANLYDLIDGAADLFLSYGFVDLHLAEYTGGDSISVRAEVYRHSSATNAFGIYSQERNTDYAFIEMGTEGYIEDGVLNFLAGVHYVKLSTTARGEAGRRSMRSVAKSLESVLAPDRSWPGALGVFPKKGKIAHSELYTAENFLGYRFLRGAFTAAYAGKEPFTLFVITAETEAEARQMLSEYARAVNAPPGTSGDALRGFVDPHSGTIAMKQHGPYLFGILRYARAETARQILMELENRLEQYSAGK
jgi:hypothetical protein